MIVTCESCKSRYKLDDSKITGRGAKITCPKCKHIFVVLSAGAAPGRPPGSPAWEEDEPTKVEDAATYPPPRPAKPPEVAPRAPVAAAPAGPSPVPTSAAPSPAVLPVHEVTRPTPAAALNGTKVDYATRAMSLDFRKVGVVAWKAKIKIGLVYDFSDIKTLRRYITDGRVTPNDVISWDGKNFKPIGDIPDLDRYFVETYEMLERDQDLKGAQAAPPSQPAPTDLGNVAAVLAAAEAESKTEQVGPTFNDPFARGGKPKPKAAPRTITVETPPTRRGGNWLVLAAGALLLVGVGAWYASKGENVPAAAPTKVKQTAKVDPDAERQKMIDKYVATGQPVAAPGPGVPAPEAGTPEAAPTEVPTVNPEVAQAKEVVAGGKVPEGFTPKAPSAEELARQQGGKATATGPSVNSRDSSASDFEELGDASKAAGNWGDAKASYQKAKAAGGGGAALSYKIGEAQLRSGDADGAIRTLEAIKKAYPAAHSLLAEAYDKVGDSAKANAERSAAGG